MADSLEGPEGNDSAPQATAGAEVELTSRALSLCAGDRDWFRFELADYQRLYARAEFEAGDVDLDLEVYVDDGTTLIAASRAGPGIEAVGVPAGGEARTMWLRVVAADGGRAPYLLTAAVENETGCSIDPGEPNDVPAEAGPGTAGVYSLCDFDEDVYGIDLSGGKRLQARIEFSPSDGDLDLQLLHPDGSTPLETSDGVGGSEEIVHVGNLDAVHYLRVYALTSHPRARYLLNLVVEAP